MRSITRMPTELGYSLIWCDTGTGLDTTAWACARSQGLAASDPYSSRYCPCRHQSSSIGSNCCSTNLRPRNQSPLATAGAPGDDVLAAGVVVATTSDGDTERERRNGNARRKAFRPASGAARLSNWRIVLLLPGSCASRPVDDPTANVIGSAERVDGGRQSIGQRPR